ncbi:DUF6228 family protein [Streptomyces sp. NBC_01637]|uniref:DUF6228 family protein n=1 Tax=unclassified Streptomyces TaxID=2593676 RepID=UPI00386FE54E|nr:DUF6228 family protein [Streptomyces sp. NBC_01653]WTD93008.1 DUF6228 family protein [Streptomyces sp. NBC_01637]
MTSLDTDEHTGVTIRCHDNLAVGLRLSERQLFDEDCAQYAVEVWAPGLRARVDEVVAWIWDADLASFLAELVVLGQVDIGVGMSRWQVGQAPVQTASRVWSSRTTW